LVIVFSKLQEIGEEFQVFLENTKIYILHLIYGVKVGQNTFINLYRPPSGNKTEFEDIITRYLDTIRGQKLVIDGDFNLSTVSDCGLVVRSRGGTYPPWPAKKVCFSTFMKENSILFDDFRQIVCFCPHPP
jgi:hypothetical protein